MLLEMEIKWIKGEGLATRVPYPPQSVYVVVTLGKPPGLSTFHFWSLIKHAASELSVFIR